MTKEELEKATGQELIDERNYCGVDGYYGDYLDNVNAEMLKRFNHIAEIEEEKQGLKDYCDKYTKTILSLRQNVAELEAQIEQLTYLHNEDVNTIRLLNEQIRKMKCCANCAFQLVIGGVRDRHCVKCNACSEWELEG